MFSNKVYCPRCDSKLKKDFDFCPHCGLDIRNPQRDNEEWGILGKNEFAGAPFVGGNSDGFGVTDKMIGAIFNSLMKNLEKQIQNQNQEESVQQFPKGLTISVGPAKKKQARKGITEEQIKRMSGLPRVEAKTNMKRLSDKVVYELKAPGIDNPDDVFISKLASGYEVKAIGKNKVYMNSLPVELPLKGFILDKNGLNIEFSTN